MMEVGHKNLHDLVSVSRSYDNLRAAMQCLKTITVEIIEKILNALLYRNRLTID